MNWNDVEKQARGLERAAVVEQLRQLADLPQFAALVAVTLELEEEAAANAANPKACRDPGTLAHTSGALYQARLLKERLRALERPPQPQGGS